MLHSACSVLVPDHTVQRAQQQHTGGHVLTQVIQSWPPTGVIRRITQSRILALMPNQTWQTKHLTCHNVSQQTTIHHTRRWPCSDNGSCATQNQHRVPVPCAYVCSGKQDALRKCHRLHKWRRSSHSAKPKTSHCCWPAAVSRLLLLAACCCNACCCDIRS